MANCIIFCAGEFSGLATPIEKGDYIIAADGGYRHTCQLGLTPDAVLGDFDSLGYAPENATVFPVEKDDTDAMLAVRHGLERGYRKFVFYGALDGPRLDHTVANLQTLAFLADQGAAGCLVGTDHVVTVIRNGSRNFPAGCSGTVSVFCIGKDANGVTLENLKYPLESGTLTAAFPLGVSNRFTGRPARISVENGTLLVLCERQAGIL